MKNPTTRVLTASLAVALIGMIGCKRDAAPTTQADDHGTTGESAPAPTNRIDIPAPVRRNLGITFAKAEYRAVSRTLRVPGRFELLPTARREYRAPVPGRIEPLVSQYQAVEAGTALYRVESARYRELHERAIAAQALVDSMGPIREAHRAHERGLADKVALWQERLKQLEELRAAGGGSAAQFTEARATLNATQAELGDVMEKDAELEARQKQAEAELRTIESHLALIARSAHCGDAGHAGELTDTVTVCATAPGVVELLGVTPGGSVEEGGAVLTLVQPEQVRFRARALQSDLARLRDGLPARVTPPSGGAAAGPTAATEVMTGALQIGLAADPDERTIDLIVSPTRALPWARAGVAASLEVTLEGGSEELAIPLAAVVRDNASGGGPVIFRRDPANPDKVIRMDADLGVDDGRWIIVNSGVKEGDEIVVGGNYQLMLATSGAAPKGGHFHPDGTFHEGEH